jgi:hypothetical protein
MNMAMSCPPVPDNGPDSDIHSIFFLDTPSAAKAAKLAALLPL